MKNLLDTAAMLRGMANALDESQRRLRLPTQTVNIESAAEELRLLLGPHAYFSIRMELDYHAHSGPVVGWNIWEGAMSFEAPTLAEVVNKVKASRMPSIVADPVEAIHMAEATLDQLPL